MVVVLDCFHLLSLPLLNRSFTLALGTARHYLNQAIGPIGPIVLVIGTGTRVPISISVAWVPFRYPGDTQYPFGFF